MTKLIDALEGRGLVERRVQTSDGRGAALVLTRVGEIEFVNHQKRRVEGLYTIDEARLQALPAGTIAELHALEHLAPIYTMLASLGHIYALVQRKNQCLL